MLFKLNILQIQKHLINTPAGLHLNYYYFFIFYTFFSWFSIETFHLITLYCKVVRASVIRKIFDRKKQRSYLKLCRVISKTKHLIDEIICNFLLFTELITCVFAFRENSPRKRQSKFSIMRWRSFRFFRSSWNWKTHKPNNHCN